MNPEPTPWETAADELQFPRRSATVKKVIKAACEAHAKAVTEERDRLAAQLKLATEDWAEDDTAIRDLCRPILGDAAAEGDGYGVPAMVELVEKLVAEHKVIQAEFAAQRQLATGTIEAGVAENAALRAQVKRLREALEYLDKFSWASDISHRIKAALADTQP